MNNTSQSLRVGLFFLLGVALIWIVYETLGGSSFSQPDGFTISAQFDNVKQLKNGDEVRMSGVLIGQVIETTLQDGTAITKLAIEERYQVPAQSVATITSAGLLGSNYVAITWKESTEMLSDGDKIETKSTPDIGEVIAQIGDIGKRIDNLLAGVEGSLGLNSESGEGPGELFTNLNQLVNENKDNFSKTMENFRVVSDRLAQGEGTLGKLMTDDSAYEKIMNTSEDVSLLVADARSIMGDVQTGKGTLGMLLYDEELAQTMRRSMNNVEQFTSKLNSEDSTLGKLISSDDLYLQAQSTVQKLNSAVDSINDSGPITAVGVATNALF